MNESVQRNFYLLTYDLGNNFIGHITKTNRPEVLKGLRIICFRDTDYISLVHFLEKEFRVPKQTLPLLRGHV